MTSVRKQENEIQIDEGCQRNRERMTHVRKQQENMKPLFKLKRDFNKTVGDHGRVQARRHKSSQ